MAADHQHLSRVIFEYAGRIGREQNRDALLSTIADLGRDLVGADRCSIWMIEESTGDLVTRVAHGSSEIRIGLHEGLVGDCVTTGSVVLSNRVDLESRFAAPVDARTGYRTSSVLAVPMRTSDGSVIGAFQALNKPGGFHAEDADLLSLAAAYSASTIETQSLLRRAEEARRMERDLEIAREVQQRLLPAEDLPAVAGLEYGGVCRPAEEVGGDYYAFIPQPNGGIAMALGDISGKGIAAALLMASAQASLSGLAMTGTLEPSQVLGRMNTIIYNYSTAGRYSTLFFGQYEPESRRLTFVNAGHPYPVLLRCDGTVERLEEGGPPLGLLPEAEFTQQELALNSGDTLICYSDGLADTHNCSGKRWGDAGVKQAIVSLRGRDLKVITQDLIDAAEQFADGAEQFDDITVAGLRVTN